jgi:cyclic lactone autoinducer peptide
MNKNRNFKPLVNMLGLCLVVIAQLVSKSNCFAFIGEPNLPKSLLE